VAAIGMAVGGGSYVIAIATTLLILGVLSFLGFVEQFLDLKLSIHSYEVSGGSAEAVTVHVNEILEPLHLIMQNVQVAPTPRHVRVHFECEGTRTRHAEVLRMLEQSGAFDSVIALGPVEAE